MAKLSYGQRKELKASDFVFPNERAYPIHDEAHARNALTRASQNESGARLTAVVHAVMHRYPHMDVDPNLIRRARRGD